MFHKLENAIYIKNPEGNPLPIRENQPYITELSYNLLAEIRLTDTVSM